MAMTGVLNALDRGLVDAQRDVVVHGTGTYQRADYPSLEVADTVPVRCAEDVAKTLLAGW